MNIYVIRHGIAVEPDAPGYEDDKLRPLTEKGHMKMINIGHGLKAMGVHFDLILTSPYLRAYDTAHILQGIMKMKKDQVVVSEALIPMGEPDQLISDINEKYPLVDSIAVVGHEPNLSALISLLIAGDSTLSINIKKGGVCHLSADNLLHERRATLEWMLAPKQLMKLGEQE